MQSPPCFSYHGPVFLDMRNVSLRTMINRSETMTAGKEQILEEVRQIFSEDKFATENGAFIEAVGENYAKCSMPLTRHHRNAMGAVMGAAYYTLADFTFAVAANWQQMGCVSLNAAVSYLGAAKGETLIAEAICLKNGKSTCCYRIDIKDELGNLAAAVTTTGYRKS